MKTWLSGSLSPWERIEVRVILEAPILSNCVRAVHKRLADWA